MHKNSSQVRGAGPTRGSRNPDHSRFDRESGAPATDDNFCSAHLPRRGRRSALGSRGRYQKHIEGVELVDQALFRSRAIRYLPQASGSHGQAKPSAQTGGGCAAAARRLRGATRRCCRAVLARHVDGAFADAALASDDVFEAVRGKEVGDVVGHGLADRLDLDAIGLRRRRECADHCHGR